MKRSRRTRYINGFTLLELVVSAVLTAMLMTGLLSVLRSAFLTQKQSDRVIATAGSPRLLRAQLEKDFQNARGILAQPNGVVLFGFLGQDSEGMPNYRPAYVGYRIGPAGLLRWHGNLLPAARRPVGSLVWAGAAKFTVKVDQIDDTERSNASLQLESGGLPPAPRRIRCALSSATGRLITQFSVAHTEEFTE